MITREREREKNGLRVRSLAVRRSLLDPQTVLGCLVRVGAAPQKQQGTLTSIFPFAEGKERAIDDASSWCCLPLLAPFLTAKVRTLAVLRKPSASDE